MTGINDSKRNESVDDDERSRRSSTSTNNSHIEQVNTLNRSNRCMTIRELAEECNISIGSCYEILIEKLMMHREATKFVSRLMMTEQKEHHIQVCQKLLEHAEGDENFLSLIITGNESWFYDYNSETKSSLHNRSTKLHLA